jgi:hypothetical protein
MPPLPGLGLRFGEWCVIERWRYPGIVLDKAVSVGRKRQRTGAVQKLAHGSGAQADAKRHGVRQSSAAFC